MRVGDVRARAGRRFAIRLVGSVAVFWIVFRILPWAEVEAGFRALRWRTWLITVALFVAGHGAGVVKWRLVVNLGKAGLKFRDAVRCYSAGLFANLCLPSIVGGDVLRAALATKVSRRPEAVVLGAVGDRFLDVAALGTLIGFGVLASRESIPFGLGGVLVATTVAGGGLAIVSLVVIGRRRLRAWPLRFRRRVGRSLVALRRMRRRPATAMAALGLAVSIQGGFVLINAYVGSVVGVTTPVWTWFIIWPVSKLAALLPVSLNGLGVRDATQGALLASFGQPGALGVVTSLVWQSVLVAGGLMAGMLWWVLGARDKRLEGERS